jgi:hypothetical protein
MDDGFSRAGHRGGRIEGWRDFRDRFHAILAMSLTTSGDFGWCDPDFSAWPLGERSAIDALQQWALQHPGGRLTLLAARGDELPRRHARWLSWRQPWSHRVSCWVASEEVAAGMQAMCLWRGEVGLKIVDPLSGRGIWSTDPATVQVWQADFDAYLQRSSEGMPCTTLGL